MKFIVILTASTVLLAGCGAGAGADEPTTAGTAPPPAVGATSTPHFGSDPKVAPAAPPARTAGAGAAARTPLGPTGFGPLRLGMTVPQAAATRLLVGKVRGTACNGYDFRSHRTPAHQVGVYISRRSGLATIFALGRMHTPQGIGLGATLAQVQHAYPKLKTGVNTSTAAVPGNPRAVYTFAISGGKVTAMSLDLQGQDCH
ncbi:hypothetical protein [Actinomadura roseirufa]|uniref:hypothetical protein n=1 Tax=Actinomadura roseirufa TaxID=2094049 RepID=UPI001041482C|nr:hypothetical protein [Actinomadura roseirufa]